MELKDISKDKPIDELTDEEIEFLTSDHEMGKVWEDIILTIKAYSAAVKAIKDIHPKFKGKTLKQLNDDNDFHQALKEYKAKNPSTLHTKQKEIKEALKSIIPEYYYITNNKLSNEITKDFVNNGRIALDVIKSKKKSAVTTYNSLTYDDKNINITRRNDLTAYDRAIHNAVCSLWVAGNDIVTPAMAYRAVNGMTETEYVSPQANEAVENSLDKTRVLLLRVDFTNEAKARGFNVEETIIEDYLLNAKKIKVKAGGNLVTAYKINEMPILYQYAQYTKQILAISPKLFDTKEVTRNTEEIIPIREHLVRRIETMKTNKTMSNKILYDTIFEETGIIITDQKQKNRIRSYITAILDLWKTRDKYIKDFKEYKVKKTFKGIEIHI